MPKTHGMEQYLQAIYVLGAEGETVLPSVLADYLDVARPTVTQTVQRLTSAGLVSTGEGKGLTLTDQGFRRAETLVRRHRLVERWLTDDLGLDWASAHLEAGRLEHVISPLVEQRLVEHLGYPITCPHGNVIPGSGAAQQAGLHLSAISPPARVQVVRIAESAEEDLNLLRFLHQTGFVPGAILTLLNNKSPYEAGISVQVEDHVYALDEHVAQRVVVLVLSTV
ncbi:metal-dependent transcriptional regulator [Alicyclobacillaceae bacterium I2511]|nr:metal-dependent transcriptional regulator [Alicyclobacillaceae bacterium I2511]